MTTYYNKTTHMKTLQIGKDTYLLPPRSMNKIEGKPKNLPEGVMKVTPAKKVKVEEPDKHSNLDKNTEKDKD